MGADFKGKTKKSFEKAWDKAAVRANTPDLFEKKTSCAPDIFEAEPIGESSIAVGDFIYIRFENNKLIGRKGVSPVLVIGTPTPALTRLVLEGSNIASISITASDPISGVYEVTVEK